MKSKACVRTAAMALAAAFCAGAMAQTPAVRTDVGPSPAEDRNSVGAIVMMDEPVLAQREAMQQMLANAPDTRSMGAGPSKLLRRDQTKEELQMQRALDAAERQRQRGTPN